MNQTLDNLITTTIGKFCDISDIGRSKVYELLDAGDLDSIKIGKRRLILLDSYRRLIERQRSAALPAEAGDGQGSTATVDVGALPRRGRGRPRKAAAEPAGKNEARTPGSPT